MIQNKPTIVLFPGEWGHRTLENAEWWFEYVATFFRHQGWHVVTLHYYGSSLSDYVSQAVMQLITHNVQNGCYALCFSMGAQVARGVCTARPHAFRKVVLAAGVERDGIHLSVDNKALLHAFTLFVRSLPQEYMALTDWQQIWRLMYARKPGTEAEAKMARTHMQPEPVRVILELLIPGRRITMQPFPCPVLALVPEYDFVVGHPKYQGEKPFIVPATGLTHALIRSPEVVALLDGTDCATVEWLQSA